MNVLLLFPVADGQTGPAIKHAFENLGHKVIAVDAKLEPQNSFLMSQQLDFDIVFCSRTKELAPEVEKIRKRLPDAKICMWNVDTRNTIEEWSHLFPLIRACDHHFVVAYNLIPKWKAINPNTHWLPQGLQDEVYDRPEKITDADRARYSCDVSFAGSCTGYHKWRKPYLNAIDEMGLDFKLWGCREIARVYNEEHNKMAALSKINFAYSGWINNGRYVSVRNFKIMGAGGFLLKYRGMDVDMICPPDTLDYYSTIPELKEKILYWLAHEKERKERAERAYKWVHENATYTHRIQQALEYMR